MKSIPCQLLWLAFSGVGLLSAQPMAVPATPYVFQPQTAHERWQAYADEAFLTPISYLRSLVPAIGDQWRNEPSEWGQGFEGYSKRAAARLARDQMESVMYHAGAAAVGYQTGYDPCRCEGAVRRFGHAIVRVFVTRDSHGRSVPNLPLLGASYAAGMISTNWYPTRYSPWKEGVRSANVDVSFNALSNVVHEFTPEIKRVLHIH